MRKISKALIFIGMACFLIAGILTFNNMLTDLEATNDLIDENQKVLTFIFAPRVKETIVPHETLSPTVIELVNNENEWMDEWNEKEMAIQEIDGIKYVCMLDLTTINIQCAVRAEWNYKGLKKSPCRYVGSAYQRNLVICGHNFSSHFGKLKELQIGDMLTLIDMDGVKFTYTVQQIEQLQPLDVMRMIESDYDLTLFTCTVGGKARVTVGCSLISIEALQT